MTLHTAVHACMSVFPYQLVRGSGGCLYLGAAAKKMIIFTYTLGKTPQYLSGEWQLPTLLRCPCDSDVPLLYTGLLQEVPELYLESSGSSSYHFIHKTVQEFMAALYVSSLPPGERAQFVRTSFDKSNMTMVMRFMAGLTKFQSEDDIKSILALQKKDGRSLLESLHWLFEAHDPGLVHKCMGHREWKFDLSGVTFDPFDCYVIGYCISKSRQPWSIDLRSSSTNAECMKMLTVVENGSAFDYITSIKFNKDAKLGDQGAIVIGELYSTHKVLKYGTEPQLLIGPYPQQP